MTTNTAPAAPPKRRRLRRQHAGWLGTVAALVVFAGSVFPVYWMLNTSLLPNRLIRNYEPTFFPSRPPCTTTPPCSRTASSRSCWRCATRCWSR